ncbi:formyltetrahydrofolate deformylase [Sandaracinobacteroides saxicola]|uniref:Formyltetrahydrofolate deformylase n=1 Tax=Sandaracinobacteroides saxicola TaxID=2759707 RepID=A0A7G5IG74_9SPHN|nr:formyltetrahydrofolate deformylase [Sandaracinobacteroides saxicola]QMW22366.1 formyltetrahydrofolate deformylase [Sandaracinobacteroides saxicola]
MSEQFVLTLSCPDRRGIVAAVAGFLSEALCNIIDSAQFGNAETQRFFMRVSFADEAARGLTGLRRAFAGVAARFGMEWGIHDCAAKLPLLIMASRAGHCLNDLLFRVSIGALPVTVVAIVSNHQDMAGLAATHGVPFHHVPVGPGNKPEAEARLRAIHQDSGAAGIVLARYMQVLSGEFCAAMPGRIINIHHSFLPSFKGARPYHQAHARGVKLIGATAHYVTTDLDEGPIIEQEVARVDHGMSADTLAALGRDLETLVLARAVKWHAENRVLMDGSKTVVFR